MDIGIHNLGLFIVSGLVLNMMPGPDSLLIMARSSSQGWRAGAAATLGIGAGVMVHVLTAAVGLSALLATSSTAFSVVKWCGAAYIIYLGLTMLRQTPEQAPSSAPLVPLSYRRIFWQGFLTDVLNPKVAIFFLAFVPQFISETAPSKAVAFVILGLIFNFNCMLWFYLLARGTALASARMRIRSRLAALLKRGAGSMFIILGIRLALAPDT